MLIRDDIKLNLICLNVVGSVMKTLVLAMAVSAVVVGCSAPQEQLQQDQIDIHPTKLFGSARDVSYSVNLWNMMEKKGLVGERSLSATPYKGQPPHGAILTTVDTRLTMGSNKGELIIKKNYDGPGVSKQTVADDPQGYLKAITVMYRRTGYDPENKDWFWVKYKPDGSLHTNPSGMPLAGRVAKGMSSGCIACHQAAPGGDFVFNHDKFNQPWSDVKDMDQVEPYYDHHESHGDHIHY
jgi:hypothetical protein